MDGLFPPRAFAYLLASRGKLRELPGRNFFNFCSMHLRLIKSLIRWYFDFCLYSFINIEVPWPRRRVLLHLLGYFCFFKLHDLKRICKLPYGLYIASRNDNQCSAGLEPEFLVLDLDGLFQFDQSAVF